MHLSRINVIIFACLLAAVQVHAATYYVTPGNNDVAWAACTNINTPCDGRTAVENAVAGDIVYFRGGIYDPAANPVSSWSSAPNELKYEHLPWNPSNSGTSIAPITFQAYQGEIPVFLDNMYGGTIGVVGKSWIIWDGFTGTIVEGAPEFVDKVIAFAYFQDASNCVFRNGNITGLLKNTTDNAGLILFLKTTNILIENNRLHDMNDLEGGVEAINAAAILSFESTGLTVKNNDIYNNYLGIWDKDTEQNNRYYQNHIWGGSTYATRCRVGIQIRESQSDYSGAATNPQAYQNVIRNCGIGIWPSYDDINVITSAKVYNNVIFYDSSLSNAESGIIASTDSHATEIYNNIIDGYSIPVRYYSPVATTVLYSNQNSFFNTSSMTWRAGYAGPSYSPLSAWTTATTFDANSILTDPRFVNAGGTNPADYKLAGGSPALGAGRNGTDNIGAYPTSTSPSIGSSLVRPKAPVLLP